MPFKALIFDFDGTVSDSSEGIFASANTALAELGFPTLDMPTLRKFLGPPLQQSFMDECGMTLEESRRAIAVYRREYDAGNCFRLRIYDGMEALLLHLRKAGIKTAVASSKPTIYLEKILRGIGIRDLFDTVQGVGLDRLESRKHDLIAAAAARLGVPVQACLMVGDRRFDIEGANALGMRSVGVLYGYGSREELERAGATWLAQTCGEIENIAAQLLQNLTEKVNFS